MPLNLEAIKARCEKATESSDLTLTQYAHGGGRLFVIGGPNSERKLVADFYDEDNREFYYHARTDLPALVAEVERLRKVVEETDRLVRLARQWIGDDAPAAISRALDDYVFVHPMKSAALDAAQGGG